MTQKNEPVVSSRKSFNISGRVMKFRTMLFLFVTIPFFTVSYAQVNKIVASNNVNTGELFASLTKPINSSHLLADYTSGNTTLADQQRRITGRLTDSQGNPLPGVTIQEKATTNGTLTDQNGNYSINVSSGNSILVFTYIGFTAQEITVGSQNSVIVSLAESVIGLEEVVVVGYGTQKKATVTGAIASISTARLIATPETNLSTAMVGKISGLLTTQASGAPGADQATLRIRGISTFAGTTNPLIMVDGIEAQNYNNIDPNEIENISVLKDASATAVYGVRGANGVLLITTKRGSLGKPVVSYTSQFAASTFAEMREYMNSYDYATGYNEATRYDSYLTGAYTPKYTDEAIQHYKLHDSPLFYPDSDWIDQLFKKYTLRSQHNLNISGGTENVKYFVSVGYLSQDGLFKDKIKDPRTGEVYDPGIDTRIKYDRYNFRSNFDFNVTKRLTARVNLSSQIDDGRGPENVGDAMMRIFVVAPTMSPGIWDGKIVNFSRSTYLYYNAPHVNIYGAGYNRRIGNYLNGSVRFDYNLDFLTKGLSAHATGSYQNFKSVNSSISTAHITYFAIDLGEGKYVLAPQNYESPWYFNEKYGKNRKQDFEAALDYSRTFGPHNVGGLLLYNQSKLYDPGLSFVVPNGFQGLVGRVTYDYDRRYLAEFNWGYNGTENFAPGKRFGFFPAFSLGWVASEESFFPKNNIVSWVKLRGSYGEVGNDKIGSDRFLYRNTAWTYSRHYYFGIVNSSYQGYDAGMEGRIGNPLLTWERAKKYDVGIDLTLWKDKIRITTDYFYERRDNILANKGTIPNIVGASLPAYNIGKMDNRGMDGEISFNSKAGEFNYWIKYVFTVTKNKIIYQDETFRQFPYQYRTGQPSGQTFGFVAQGFYNTWEEVNDAVRPVSSYNSNRIQPGDYNYKDINGDGIINSFDQVPIGYTAFPDNVFGFSAGGDFKGFDLSVLFTAAGHVTHMAGKKFNRGWQEDGSAIGYLKDRSWTWEKYQAGEEITMPHTSGAATQTHNIQSNTDWNENSQYVRFKNAEIGYTLGSGLLRSLGISSARFYFTGQNLFTWHQLFPGEDPEIPNYSDGGYEPYPITKTYNFGINVKF